MEIRRLPDKEYKTTIVKVFNEIKKTLHEKKMRVLTKRKYLNELYRF